MAINAFDRVSFANYTPLSAQEILMPGQMMREQHDKLDEEYALINDQLQKAAFIAQTDPNEAVREKYSNFAQQLTTSRDELMSNGINSSSRRNMYNLRGKYQSDIAPMITGYELKRDAMNRYNDLIAKDPTYRGVNPMQRSVSDYINNGLQPFTQEGYSGALITKQVAEQAKQLSDRILTDPQYKGQIEGLFGSQYVSALINRGINPEDLETNPILQNIVMQVLQSTGMDQWATDAQKQELMGFAKQGLSAAIGRSDMDVRQNQDYAFLTKMAIAQAKQQKQKESLNASWIPLAGEVTNVDIESSKVYLDNIKNKLDNKYNKVNDILNSANSTVRNATTKEAKTAVDIFNQIKDNPELEKELTNGIINQMVKEGKITNARAEQLITMGTGYAGIVGIAAKAGLSGASLGTILSSTFPPALAVSLSLSLPSSERQFNSENVLKNLQTLMDNHSVEQEIAGIKEQFPNASNEEIINIINEDNKYKSKILTTRYNSQDAGVRTYQENLSKQLLVNAPNSDTLVKDKNGKVKSLNDSKIKLEDLEKAKYLGIREYNPETGGATYDYQLLDGNDKYIISLPSQDLKEAYDLPNKIMQEIMKPYKKERDFTYRGENFTVIRDNNIYKLRTSDNELIPLDNLFKLGRSALSDYYIRSNRPNSKKSESYSDVFDEE